MQNDKLSCHRPQGKLDTVKLKTKIDVLWFANKTHFSEAPGTKMTRMLAPNSEIIIGLEEKNTTYQLIFASMSFFINRQGMYLR